MPKILFLIFIFHLCNSLYAQDYKFGKVSLADLKKAKSEIDPSAPAELLVKKVDIAFDDKYHLLNPIIHIPFHILHFCFVYRKKLFVQLS